MKDIAYKYQGLPIPKDAWDSLSMAEKSEMMRVAVKNGITNLQDIRKKYNEFAGGGYKPSDTIKKRIATYEGAAMNGAIDPLSGKWDKNDSFENEAARFYAALPESIRDKVLANPQLADNLYSYSYNVGAGNFRKRVVPALTKYYEGTGRVEDVLNSMWASGDAKLRGLRRRRTEEKEGVRNALSSLNEGIQTAPVDNTFVYNPVGPLGQTSLPTPIMIPDEKEYVKVTYTEPIEREKQDALNTLENLRKLKAFQEQMGWLFQPPTQTNTPGYVVGAYSKGGHIHIDPSKKGTFTAAASKHNMEVQEFASKVLANKDDYSPAMVKKANFARNSAKWHGLGGNLFEDGGDTSGIFGNKTIDTVTSYLPVIGTAQDAYQLYQNPSWENAGWLGLSLASDLLGAGLLKGVKALGKGAKAATKVEKAAKEALDTHRRTTKNIIARSIREEDRRLTQNLTRARENAALARGQHFWEGVTAYPVAAGWTINDVGMNAIQNSAKALGGPLVDRAMAHYYDGTSEDSQQMNIAIPDATYVARTPIFPPINKKEYDWEDAALNRTNQVYSNYNEAKDEPLSLGNTLFRNSLRWIKDNIYDDFPSGVSNCTLTATQWVDPQTPVKRAKSIYTNPERFNYTAIDSADVVPGNLIISKVPNKDSYHTMMVTGFAGQDSTANFNGKNYPVKKGEPLVTYSRGGHDNSFIQRNVPLSVYTSNSDGHTQNLFYRYNYPREVFLPEIVITPNKKKK